MTNPKRLGRLGRFALAACALVSAVPAPAAPAGSPAVLASGQADYEYFLPLVTKGGVFVDPAGAIMGANGGPIDGLDGTAPFDGVLAYYPALRAKSFYWMTEAGLRWFRNYSSDGIVYSWRFVEPADDVFDWQAWDILVQKAQENNVALLASIGDSVPQWANGSANWRDKPLDLYAEPMQDTAWYQYVYAFVERYDGDGLSDMPGLARPIKYWEFWNEPDLREGWNPKDGFPAHQFTGDVYDYVRISEVGYAAVKAADPAASVVGPSTAQYAGYSGDLCFASATAEAGTAEIRIPPEPPAGATETEPTDQACWFSWNWQQWMAAGGLNYVDVASFVRNIYDVDAWDSTGYFDAMLDSADASRGGQPVWIVETGWTGNSTDDSLNKARNLVRMSVILWSRPVVERFFWYDLQESETYTGDWHRALYQTLSGAESKGVEPDPWFHPAYATSAVMFRVLQDFTTEDRASAISITGDARVYKFTGHGREVWVYWSRDGLDHTISINTGGQTARMIGLFGEDLGTYSGGNLTAGPRAVYLTTDLGWSDNVGRIAGRVRDGDHPNEWNNGVVNAVVTLTGPLNTATTTDADGNFLFENLPEGTYTVSLPGLSTTPTSWVVELDREGAWGRTSFTVN